jgi:hypothetical protein
MKQAQINKVINMRPVAYHRVESAEDGARRLACRLVGAINVESSVVSADFVVKGGSLSSKSLADTSKCDTGSSLVISISGACP